MESFRFPMHESLFVILYYIVENIIKDDFVIAYYRKETEEERKEEEARSIIVFEDFNENGIRFKFLLLNDMNRYIDDVKFNKNIITSTSPIFEDIDAFRYLMKNTDKIINKLHNLEDDDPLLKESFDRMGISKHFSFGLDVPDYSKEELESRFIKQEIYNQKPPEKIKKWFSGGKISIVESYKATKEEFLEITETERRRKIFEIKNKIVDPISKIVRSLEY